MEPEEKVKRSKRRVDYRRKNLRDTLPRIKEEYKTHSKNKKKEQYENTDGEVS